MSKSLGLIGCRCVTVYAHPSRDRVGEHVLQNALPLRYFSSSNARLLRHLLISARLQELPDPDTAGVPSSSACRQNVIGPDRLVAISDRGLFSDKERAIIREPLEIEVGIIHVQFQVLGRITIAQAHSFVLILRHPDDTVIAPRQFSDIARR